MPKSFSCARVCATTSRRSASRSPALAPWEDRHADYRWRAEVTREEWRDALVQLAGEIEYDNFKHAVAEAQGHERADIYLRVWSALRALQEATGFERERWLRVAIAETASFCQLIEDEAVMERGFSRFGSSDYDFEIDLNHQAKLARETLARMERSEARSRHEPRCDASGLSTSTTIDG